MKIYYVANARMPNEKAHGIQIAKMCEAFIEAGVDLTLVVSSRGSGDMSRVYDLSHTIPVVRLPVFDLQFLGPVGYWLTALQFMCGSTLYVWGKILSGERFVLYTIDMDSFSFAPLALLPRPVFAEMHGAKKSNVLARYFFKRARIIATNELIEEELSRTFGISRNRFCIEPNGVDELALQNDLSQEEARTKLGLPLDESFALYVGRFYAWKGLEILAEAATRSSLPIHLVGGTRGEYEHVTEKRGESLCFEGAKPVGEISLWLAAADILIVLGTARNIDSYRFTAPMKIFEYLAARRSVVASETPALKSLVGGNAVFWYAPDDPESLARAIHEAHTSPEKIVKREAGSLLAAEHTWNKRAKRILSFIEHGD